MPAACAAQRRGQAVSHPLSCVPLCVGVKVTDLEGLRRLRVLPSAVAKLVSETFNEMIFKWGWCHCDPHDGNIFVRRAPKVRWAGCCPPDGCFSACGVYY